MNLILIENGKLPQIVKLPKNHKYTDLKRLLGIDSPLTVVTRKIGSQYYDIWLDDEGLLKDKKYISAYCDDAGEILCGNLLIACHDGEGNTVGLTDEQIKEIINASNFVDVKRFTGFKEHEGELRSVLDYEGFGKIYSKPYALLLIYNA